MEQFVKDIADKITEVAKSENDELIKISEETNQNLGLFHMPELAFAYECGKYIMENAHNIFEPDDIPVWKRELNLGNGGPSDLVFEFKDGYKIVVEFKMRDTIDAYLNDVSKLSKLKDKKIVKLFCAVIDVFEKDLETDGRVTKLNDDSRTKKVKSELFYTKQTWYKSNVFALVGIWQIR